MSDNNYPSYLMIDGEWPMIAVTHTEIQESREAGGFNNAGTWERCHVNMPARHEMKVSADRTGLSRLIRPTEHPATLALRDREPIRGTVMLNNASELRGRTSMDAVFTEELPPVKVPSFVEWLDRTLAAAERYSETVMRRALLDRKLLELHGPASWDPEFCGTCCADGGDPDERPAYIIPCPTLAEIGWYWAAANFGAEGYREEWKPDA